MSQVLARITLDPKSRQVRDIDLRQKHFRFKCRRCAALCCRLGGPMLVRRDIERMTKAGHQPKNFLQPAGSKSRSPSAMGGSLRSEEDGSCIFLGFHTNQTRYECSIYECRPALCRLYPFGFEKESSDTILLTFIPCCRGWNNPDGEVVDERFITSNLLAPLLEVAESLRSR
jgi:Fe-S-cluster containining protein